ncbi:MAG: TetR/AcrR family transcriptional regulator [Pseudomonadota bacterium]
MLENDSIFVVKSRKGYEKRVALLNATFDQIAMDGIQRLTVGGICEAVGLKRSSFYTHFSSIEELRTALANSLLHEVGSSAETSFPADPEQQFVLRDRMKFVLDYGIKNPKTAKVLHELYSYDQSALDKLADSVGQDVDSGLQSGQLKIPKGSENLYSRIVLASVMDALRDIGRGRGDGFDPNQLLNLLLKAAK